MVKKLPGTGWAYLPFVILVAVFMFLMPRTANFKYDYKKGSPWKYSDLVAQFDFPLLKSQDELELEQEQASQDFAPYYIHSDDAVVACLRTLQDIPLGSFDGLRPEIMSIAEGIYQKGVRPDDDNLDASGEAAIFIEKGKVAQKCPLSEVYTLTQARTAMSTALSTDHPDIVLDSLLTSGILEAIMPDLSYDEQKTVSSMSQVPVSTTLGYFSAGETIIKHGEIVTAEKQQVLDSYKSEYESTVGYGRPLVLLWTGNFLLSLALVSMLWLAIFLTNDKLFYEHNKLLYLLFISLLTILIAYVATKIDDKLLYISPFVLMAIYLQAFFKNKVIIAVYLVSLLPVLVFSRQGVIIYFIFASAGLTSIFLFHWFRRGWRQFIAALLSYLVMLAVYSGFRLTDVATGNFVHTIALLFGASMLSVLGYPLVYLFEKMFNLMSSSRLNELSDTSNQLLRDLNDKAPGTYQHSIQVMNMSEAAARAIGANEELVKVGALYHDIGKMCNPACFVENESLLPASVVDNYHEGISNQQSAKDIIRHVTDGMDLAQKYHIPEVIADFIITHHGDTCVTYFLNKYLNEGGDPSNIQDFKYPGRKPRSKEQIILMVCDSVEAASRSLKSASADDYAKLVDNIFKSKQDEGQFSDADITMKELTVIKSEITSYLIQLNHKRIAYPKRDKQG